MLDDSSIDPLLELQAHVNPSMPQEIERTDSLHWFEDGVDCFSLCLSPGFLEDWPENPLHLFIGPATREDSPFYLYRLKNAKVADLPNQSISDDFILFFLVGFDTPDVVLAGILKLSHEFADLGREFLDQSPSCATTSLSFE